MTIAHTARAALVALTIAAHAPCALAAVPTPGVAPASAQEWQGWHRDFMAHHSIRYGGPITWDQEGVDGIDCRSVVLGEIQDLMDRGVSVMRMRVLVVPATARYSHVVLQIDGDKVADDGSPYIERPDEYRPICHASALLFLAFARSPGSGALAPCGR